MNPSENITGVLAGVHETRDATSRALTLHYERSSEWLTEAIQTCKRKILEGTGHDVVEPKRMKKSEKENVAAHNNNSNSVVKAEKKSKKVVPASAKKTSAKREQQQQVHSLPVMSMKVVQLRNELRQRNLDTTGLKKDLQQRLLHHIQAEEKKKRQESRSVIKSAKKAKAAAAISSAKKDRDGDVKMKDADKTSEKDESRRDSSKMDVDDDDAARRKNDTSMASKAKETTVAKSFLKSTAELFSPQKIATSKHAAKKDEEMVDVTTSSAVKETKPKPVATQSKRSSLAAGLKKTATAILSASSPVRKAPVTKLIKSPYKKSSAAKAKPAAAKPKEAPVGTQSENQALDQPKPNDSSSKSDLMSQPLNAAAAPAIPTKLGSVDKSAGAATKAKRNKCTADRMARLAEIRGKSKPIASTKSGAAKDLPVLNSSKALKLGSTKGKDSKNDRKLLLTAQMREKAAGMKAPSKAPTSSKLMTSQPHQPQQSEPLRATTNTANAPASTKITASPKVAVQKKQVAPSSSTKAAKASSSKKKKSAARPDVLSPMSTYEMSDQEHSDSDESESESHHHRQKKKVPSWALKSNLLPALENQYANANGQLDPETIFPPVATCNLEDIFDQKKSRYNRRTSSANWSKDGVTASEIVAYKRTMGY